MQYLSRSPVLRSVVMFPFPPSRTCSPAAAQQARTIDAAAVARELERRADLDLAIVNALRPETRRYLVVAAASLEWYGAAKVPGQLRAADADRDRVISSSDYEGWVRRSIALRVGSGVSFRVLMMVALYASCPFMAFGWLDNSVMLLSGGAIDRMLGEPLHLSMMAAAALGGVVSGTMGIQIHGLAERLLLWLGLKGPSLTAVQASHISVFRAQHLGGTFGIIAGLMLGMWPLLLAARVSDTEEVLDRVAAS